MIKVDKEQSRFFKTCQSCGEKQPNIDIYAIIFTLQYDENKATGTNIRICRDCLSYLSEIILKKLN